MRVVMIAEYDVVEDDDRATATAMQEFGDTLQRRAWPYSAPKVYVAIKESADAVIAIVSGEPQ